MSETIEDIVADIRAQNQGLPEDSYALSPQVCDLLSLADRIDAAWKREREAGAEAAQICGEIGEMVGREAACKHSVTNCNRFGNAAKMREALEKADAALSLISKSSWFIDANFSVTKAVIEAVNAIEDALSAPPRNCDVGTPEEQSKRHREWCRQARWVFGCIRCMAEWLQLQYVRELQTTGEVVK